MINQALIMAGGKGTRLHSVTEDKIPKPMVFLCGKPLLQYAIEQLKENGIDKIFISVGHLHEKIVEYFGDGSKFGVKIEYIIEAEPLGSGGSLCLLKGKINGDFVTCSGDTLFKINIKKMYDFHKMNNALATLLVRPTNHPFDSDLIVEDKNNAVVSLLKKDEVRNDYCNLANAGFCIISSDALSSLDKPRKMNLEHDFICSLIDSKRVFAYRSVEFIRDMGTANRLISGEKALQKGLMPKRRAIFLDRDGVINRYKGFIRNPNEIEILPTVIEAIKTINDSEYLAIVISNQPVVARGECTFEELDNVFKRIETLLGNEGVYLDRIYFCPHHPDKGFFGEIPELKIDCDCRKPKTGLVMRAIKDFDIDLTKCYMIGDDNRDLELAKNLGIQSVFIKSELSAKPKFPFNFSCDTLREAIQYILGENNETNNRKNNK